MVRGWVWDSRGPTEWIGRVTMFGQTGGSITAYSVQTPGSGVASTLSNKVPWSLGGLSFERTGPVK